MDEASFQKLTNMIFKNISFLKNDSERTTQKIQDENNIRESQRETNKNDNIMFRKINSYQKKEKNRYNFPLKEDKFNFDKNINNNPILDHAKFFEQNNTYRNFNQNYPDFTMNNRSKTPFEISKTKFSNFPQIQNQNIIHHEPIYTNKNRNTQTIPKNITLLKEDRTISTQSQTPKENSYFINIVYPNSILNKQTPNLFENQNKLNSPQNYILNQGITQPNLINTNVLSIPASNPPNFNPLIKDNNILAHEETPIQNLNFINYQNTVSDSNMNKQPQNLFKNQNKILTSPQAYISKQEEFQPQPIYTNINPTKTPEDFISLKKEISNLKIELDREKKHVDVQNVAIIDLQNQLKNSNNLNNNYINFIKNLQNIIQQKDQELIKLRNELNNLINYNKSIQNKNLLNRNQLMTVNFISTNGQIHYAIPCSEDDIFAMIEEKLYQEFPKYRETDNIFLANGKKVLRFKTIKENNIGNGFPVTFVIPEKEENKNYEENLENKNKGNIINNEEKNNIIYDNIENNNTVFNDIIFNNIGMNGNVINNEIYNILKKKNMIKYINRIRYYSVIVFNLLLNNKYC